MKKNILLSGLVALLAVFSGCEMNEEPKSEASVDMVFSSENGLKTYTYSFYNVLPSRLWGEKFLGWYGGWRLYYE